MMFQKPYQHFKKLLPPLALGALAGALVAVYVELPGQWAAVVAAGVTALFPSLKEWAEEHGIHFPF